jgi:hypothetical protein
MACEATTELPRHEILLNLYYAKFLVYLVDFN